MSYLMPAYMNLNGRNTSFHILNFIKEIRLGMIDAFMSRLQSFFADTPYELIRNNELHYQNVLFIIFKLMGFYTEAEYHTSQGRIDMVVKTPNYIYIMEFKFEGSAEEALAQIEANNYAVPFSTDNRTLFKIGINFSRKTRNIEKWIVAKQQRQILPHKKGCQLHRNPDNWQPFCILLTTYYFFNAAILSFKAAIFVSASACFLRSISIT